MAYLPTLGEVTAMKQVGHMKPDNLTKVCVHVSLKGCGLYNYHDALYILMQGAGICVEGCMRVHERVKAFLKDHLATATAQHSQRDCQ